MTGSVSISLVRINSSKWHISIHVYGRMHSDGIRSNRLKFNTFDDKRSEKKFDDVSSSREDIMCKLVNIVPSRNSNMTNVLIVSNLPIVCAGTILK